MQKINLEHLAPGMETAQPVYRRLNRKTSYLTEIISKQTRTDCVKLLNETFYYLEKDKDINTPAIHKTVDDLVDEIFSSQDILLNCFDIKTYDYYTLSHSFNVAVLSILAGITLGYNRTQLRELAIGALLHDIGKVKIDKKILNKKGALTAEEYKRIQKHSEIGFITLYSCEIPMLSSFIAYQHHERLDGSGFPRGLKAIDIHEYSQIVMVADVLHALTSDRPYRPRYTVPEAINIIEKESFSKRSVTAVLSNISLYPVGSIVLLNTGRIGQVIGKYKNDPIRPIVKIHFNSNFEQLAYPYELDISKTEQSIRIIKILEKEDIAKLSKHRS